MRAEIEIEDSMLLNVRSDLRFEMKEGITEEMVEKKRQPVQLCNGNITASIHLTEWKFQILIPRIEDCMPECLLDGRHGTKDRCYGRRQV